MKEAWILCFLHALLCMTGDTLITYVTMCTRGHNLNTGEFQCEREREREVHVYVEFIKLRMVSYQQELPF